MATHKVIQDIEAEDKFLGPLTLKQFVFAGTGGFFAYLSVFAATRGFPWAIGIFAPFALVAFFLAIPWSKEQPTEVWVLAKIRFRIVPKKRVWNQDGLLDLVTITAPKKIEKRLTNDLDQDEVQSRLKILAATIDSRGWAVKNAELDPILREKQASDRLISQESAPRDVPTIDARNIPDPYDTDASRPSNIDTMIQQSSQNLFQQNLDKMERIRQGQPIEQPAQVVHFTPAPPDVGFDSVSPAQAQPSIKKQAVSKAGQTPISPSEKQTQASLATSENPAIIEEYSRDNNLHIDTIARQINKDSSGDDGEVVIPLH